jgi:hypothetical protein
VLIIPGINLENVIIKNLKPAREWSEVPMKLLVLLAADYANITSDGKLNVMGIFRDINAINFPVRHPSMHLVIKLSAELGEGGDTRTLVVKLRDPDGNEILSMTGPAAIPRSEVGKTPEVNAILELKDVIFPKPGPYQFVVLVDKDYKGDLPIYLNKLDLPAEKEV